MSAMTTTEAATKRPEWWPSWWSEKLLEVVSPVVVEPEWRKKGQWKVVITGDSGVESCEDCPSNLIGGHGSPYVQALTDDIESRGGVIKGFERTRGMIWTIIFTLDSHRESFTVGQEILLIDNPFDLPEVLSEHLKSIRIKRQKKKEKARRRRLRRRRQLIKEL